MKKRILTTCLTALTLASPLYAFDLGGMLGELAKKAVIDSATQAVQGQVTGQAEPPPANAGGLDTQDLQRLEQAPPIGESPLPVDLSPDGDRELLGKRPAIAIAGYNVGAYLSARITGHTYGGQGAFVGMGFRLQGVDEAMLREVADFAARDLAERLRGNGIEVIEPAALFASEVDIVRSEEAISDDQMDGRAKKDRLITGPSGIGVVRSQGLAPALFNTQVGAKAGDRHDAIVIYPNALLDFISTSGGGSSLFSRQVEVGAQIRFALDEKSMLVAVYSREGRFMDGMMRLVLDEERTTDAPFAVRRQQTHSDNEGMVLLSNQLGLNLTHHKNTTYDVIIDKERYRQLALNAVKGLNQAIVQQIVVARR